ncbi:MULTISPECIES: EAL domain-containing protein [unclassified Fusibacter]|uniref:bifunctional diguanylate cyclase/phosphodiesterase n=1 Tax=unclassified Fusibacter TaxID=2624464 RepID=UPI0010102CE7|nr:MULTISPECIES: EAL domain-containing protein [unclassified Fusibacter]MCK8060767.1 EAL domain-containing protein [Fusibacter sp. A2]NPE23063.1 EAL domain-containing protein [Fusibacter sp. A1]RXV59735.1 EAL domain-containing protein [Fusibacter sp. A1]
MKLIRFVRGRNTEKRQIPIIKRIVYLPLLAVIIGIAGISFVGSRTIEDQLLHQMKENALATAVQMGERIGLQKDALDVIEEQFADKILIASRVLKDHKHEFDQVTIKRIAEQLNIGETNWFNSGGTILYSSIDQYVGWTAPADHPVSQFIKSGSDTWLEPIRKDSESDSYNKYGYVRFDNGEFVQIAIPADRVMELTEQFSYQKLLDDIVNDNEILSASIFAKDGMIMASTDSVEDAGHPSEMILHIQTGGIEKIESHIKFDAELNQNILHVYVPVILSSSESGMLALCYSMDHVERAAYVSQVQIFTIGILLVFIVAGILYLAQKRLIVAPIKALDDDMQVICPESAVVYRLPIPSKDPFLSIRKTTNTVLDKTQQYLEELICFQEELTASNEELEDTVSQLTANEEELRAQYDEIQEYVHKIKELKHRYEIAIDATKCFLWEYSLDTKRISFSDNFESIIGPKVDDYALEDIFQKAVHPDDVSGCRNEISAFTQRVNQDNQLSDEGIHLELRLKNESGDWNWYIMRGRGVDDYSGVNRLLTGVLVDITKQKEQESFIRYLADHDALTGLYSRRKFTEELQLRLDRNEIGAVILMDVDNFKVINDTSGHVYGDFVLQMVADTLKEIISKKSMIYRLGGDEFLIIVEGDIHSKDMENRFAECISGFKAKMEASCSNHHVTLSTGIVSYPDDGNTVEELLIKSDIAMYSAKRSGKNQYQFYNDSMQDQLSRKVEIEQLLRNALSQDGFELHYQPIVHTQTQELAYFEALIRLKDRSVTPDVFIDVAEESTLIEAIGKWVIIEAFSQLNKWRLSGFETKKVSINLSPRQIRVASFVEFVKEQLKVYELEGTQIEFEITENVLVENLDSVIEILHSLNELGISIALDDFGTGYSSISYLTYMPVSKIKLDKSLKDKFIHLESIKVMDSIINLAHGLKLSVVTEGVETLEEYRRLKRGGSDYIQGYLFSQSLTAAEAEGWLENNLKKPVISVQQIT